MKTLAILCAGTVYALFERERHWRARQMLGQIEDPGVAWHTPVSVTLDTQGEVYGKDEGVLSFVEGWLVYKGKRCSFAFAAQDTLPVRPGDSDLGWEIVRLPVEKSLIQVRFRPMPIGVKDVAPANFRAAFSEWRGSKAVSGVSILPPVDALSEQEVRNCLRSVDQEGLTIAFIFTALFFAFGIHYGPSWYPSFGVVGLIWAGFRAMRRRHRQAVLARLKPPASVPAEPVSLRLLKSEGAKRP